MAKISRKKLQREKLRKQDKKRRRKNYVVNPSMALNGLEKTLSKYEQKEILATLGGLQLIPKNHSHTVRLESACQVASSITNNGKTRVDSNQLRNTLNEYLPSQGMIGRMEDPVENLFTENIIFHGGNYIIYSGIVDGGGFILSNLLRAIFHYGKGLSSEFKTKIKLTTIALLLISNEVANRLGHTRNIVSPDTWLKDIYVPGQGRMTQLRNAVLFSREEVDKLLKSAGSNFEFLLPFIILPADSKFGSRDLQRNPLVEKPLVKSGNTIILIQPGSITAALRHFILVTAKKMGLIKTLGSNYRKILNLNVAKCLQRISFDHMAVKFPELEDNLPVNETLHRIDVDKLAYVQTIVDDASNYEEDKVFGHWDNKDVVEKLQDRRVSIVKWLLSEENLNCSQILLMIVLGGIGRSSCLGLKKQPDRTRTEITLAEELEVIANLRNCDKLTLWKHAGAKEKMLDMFPQYFGIASFLDIYALYLNYHHSFNLSDKGPVIPVLFPGYGHELRIKSVMTSDRHAILHRPKGLPAGYYTVTRRYEGDPIPIYVLEGTLSPFVRVVESYQQPLWVMRDTTTTDISDELGDMYFMIVDMVAYWLWQISPTLRQYLEPLGKTPINVMIRLEKKENWVNISLETKTDPDVNFEYHIDESNIVFTIPDRVQLYFSKENNEGDRVIIDELLKAFNALLLQYKAPKVLNANNRAEILDTHATIGYKKMLSAFPQTRAAMNPENLPRLRKLQEHNMDSQLEGIVKELNDKTLVVGEIHEKEKRIELVGKIVDLYVNRLRTLLLKVAWQPLLEWLISNNEVIHHRRVSKSITMATDIACFSDIESRVEREKKVVQDINTTALATRTLIEFIAAEPPQGTSIVSMDELDELLAISYHIFNWGSFYDQIKLGVFNHRLSILGSGRIGRDVDIIKNFQDSFVKAKVYEEIEHSVNSYGGYLEQEQENKKTESDFPEMSCAFKAEFGFTMTEVKEFYFSLTDIGFEQKAACAKLHLSELKYKMKERLKDIPDWTDSMIAKGIRLYSLKSRKTWDTIPKGFDRTDIYPWRYNRRLSYMYRPLIIGSIPRKDPLVFWGPRHTEESCRQLFTIVSNGRYKTHKDSSSEMRSYIGRCAEKLGKEFTGTVKKWFEANTDWLVDSEVPINPGTALKAGKDLGDIDILAINQNNNAVYAIECKHINSGRNSREMASEIEKFLIDVKGKKSWTKKHIERDTWLKENIGTLSSLCRLNLDNFKICSLILTSEEIPTRYLRNVPLPFLSFPHLRREGTRTLNL